MGICLSYRVFVAQESGYHSYSTFSTAFKRRMNKSVTAWMHETARNHD